MEPVGKSNERVPPWLWAAVLLVAFAVRAWGVSDQCLTMDEWYEINLAHQSVDRILHEGDGFPPLYNLLLSGVISIFGDAGGRWMSVLFSMLAVPVVGKIGHLLGGRSAGVWSASILAIMPLNVWHAQEARAYSLMLLASALALLFAMKLAQDSSSRRDWFWFGASVALGINSHYFFVFFPIVLGLTILACQGNQVWRPLLLTAIGVAVACIPLFLFIHSDFATQVAWPDKSSFGMASLGYTYISLLLSYTLGPSLRELHEVAINDAAMKILPFVVVGGLSALLIWLGADHPFRRTKPLWGLLVAPVAVGLVCNLGNVGYHGRYVCWCHLAVAVAFGIAMAHRIRPALSWSGVTILGLIFLTAIGNRQLSPRYRNEEANKAAARMLKSDPIPVIVISGYMATALRYYLDEDWTNDEQELTTRYHSDEWQLWRISHFVSPDDRLEAMREVLKEIPRESEIWLVYARPFHEDPTGKLFQMIDEHSSLKLVERFAGVDLYSVTLGSQ